MKQCSTCRQLLPLDSFNKLGEHGFQYNCRACASLYNKKWGKKNPGAKLKQRYNMTIEQKQALVDQQNNACAICKQAFKHNLDTHVDHCHGSTKVRGILCLNCNHGLGKFMDSIEILQSAINYLESHAKQNPPTPISDEDNWEGELHPQHGSVSTTGSGEDSYDLDHHQRTVRGEDADYRAQTRGGDGVGHGSEEVGSSKVLEGFKNYWNAVSKVGWP